MTLVLVVVLLALVLVGAVAAVAALLRRSVRRQVTGADADRRPREVVLAPQPLVAQDDHLVTARVTLTVRPRVDGQVGWREDDVRPLEVLVVSTLRSVAGESPADDLLASHHAVTDRLQRLLRLSPVGHDVRADVRLERGTPPGPELSQRTVVRVLDA